MLRGRVVRILRSVTRPCRVPPGTLLEDRPRQGRREAYGNPQSVNCRETGHIVNHADRIVVKTANATRPREDAYSRSYVFWLAKPLGVEADMVLNKCRNEIVAVIVSGAVMNVGFLLLSGAALNEIVGQKFLFEKLIVETLIN